MLALVMPHSIAQTLFRAAEWCADIQNSFIERAVEMGIGYTELRIEDSTTAIIYATMALLLIISFGFKAKKEQ
jgi:hypothetical protein